MNRTKKAGLSVKSGLSLMCIVCLLCGLLCGFFWLAGKTRRWPPDRTAARWRQRRS